MNMWETARPVVTEYIRTNLGPQAVARDLAATVRILSRLGPRLPQMAEAALIRASAPAAERGAAAGAGLGVGARRGGGGRGAGGAGEPALGPRRINRMAATAMPRR